ncbi:hypothetical protein VWY34_15480 [Phaeobacter sp. JH20_02]|uniref:hypothetical protein n=1 Tax=Phaeobacter sp. JH20_02 TaxID=3112461 RepID=UPI003A864F4B
MNEERITRRLEELRLKLSESGVEVCLVDSADAIEAMMQDVGKDGSHPVSEVELDQISNGLAFWLALKKGRHFVACISARFTEITDGGFEEYWRDFCAEKYPCRSSLVLGVRAEVDALIHGRVVYFGGVQVAENVQGNISRLRAFIEFAKLQAHSMWQWDTAFTIINAKHRPLARVYRFTDLIEGAVCWSDPPPKGLSNDQIFLTQGSMTVLDG